MPIHGMLMQVLQTLLGRHCLVITFLEQELLNPKMK